MKDCDLNEKPVVIMVDVMEVTMEVITEAATIVHIGLVLDLDFILVLPVLELVLVAAAMEAVLVGAAMEAGTEATMEDFMAKNNEPLCANNKSGLVYGLYITTKHSM